MSDSAHTIRSSDAAPPQESREAVDFGQVLEKLKLLQFGLFGLQQYGKNAPVDVEDLGPFYRLAEEIESDVLDLARRLALPGSPDDTRA